MRGLIKDTSRVGHGLLTECCWKVFQRFGQRARCSNVAEFRTIIAKKNCCGSAGRVGTVRGSRPLACGPGSPAGRFIPVPVSLAAPAIAIAVAVVVVVVVLGGIVHASIGEVRSLLPSERKRIEKQGEAEKSNDNRGETIKLGRKR